MAIENESKYDRPEHAFRWAPVGLEPGELSTLLRVEP